MKNIIAIISLLILLVSCKVETETIFYADKTTTLTASIDLKKLRTSLDEFRALETTEDSIQSPNTMEFIDNLPTEWINLYELAEKEGQKLNTHPDSIKLSKKTWIKKIKENDETVGVSIRLNRLTKNELNAIIKQPNQKNRLNKSVNAEYWKWDGKKLIIDTKYLNKKSEFNKELYELNATKNEDSLINRKMMEILKLDFNHTLKFENKIKKIKGKHDWIKQIDDYTLKITFSTEMLEEENHLKHADEKIIVITK